MHWLVYRSNDYVKYLCVCMCVCVCGRARAATHTHTHTNTPYLFADDIRLCDNRQALQFSSSPQVLRHITSRFSPWTQGSIFGTLLSERPRHFSHCQCLDLNLDQNAFVDNVKLINYREPFHTFKKLMSYIFRAIDKLIHCKQIAHVLKLKAIVSGSATVRHHLQRTSVVKDLQRYRSFQ